ncbi:BCCT family transporter [uncultured Rothia sp.]|uniref:BCCT family transporter n=1 Tax=uncultured Rothia sp. TaxID=316088 RepID=UPI0032169A90
MLLKLHDRLGLRTNPPIFFTTAGFIVLFTLSFIAFPTQMEGVFGAMAQWIITYFGWFYVLGNALFFIFLVYLAASRFGRVKLGPDDSVPQYSGVAWFGMLFAAGVGAVLLFWGAAEPISHFANPPYDGVEPQSDRAARDALAISNFHIGLFMWVILTVPGLAFGYFTYKRKLPPRVSSIFQPILGEGIHGPLGKMIDALAIISTVFGLAVSVGLGALQINSGLQVLYGVPYSGWIQAGIIALVTAAGVTSVVAGMDKGVKRLSYFNILMVVALLLFILMAGSTRTVLMGTIESAGYFLMRLPEMMFFNDAFADTGWIGSWTVFYWAWTVSWAPFVGLFIARISQGRTIREFVIGVLAVPSIFVMFWIGIFGMNAFDIERNQNGQLIENVVDKGDIPAALFEFLGHFPLFEFVAPFTVLVITIFFITSIDSAALTMDAIANGHEDKAPKRQRVFWALCIGVVCAVILVTTGDSGLDILQHVIIVVGFPVFILGFLQMWMVIRALREDAGEVAPMRTRQWKQVIPAEEYRRRAREDFSSVQEVVIRPEFEEGTEPEFEARVPNTGQIRAVKADSKTEKSSSTSAE